MNRNIIFLGIVSLLNDVSSEVIAAVLPLYLLSLGSSGVGIGLIGSLSESLSNILKLFSGYFSDRIKKRKIFVFNGYLVSSIAKISFAFAGTWPVVLILKMLERTGKGLRTVPRDALIADSSAERGKAFGFHRMMDTAGAVLGAGIAILFFSLFRLSFYRIILIAGLLGFLALVPFLWVKDVSGKSAGKGLVFSWRDIPPDLKKFFAAALVFSLSNFTYMFFILKARSVTGAGQVLFLYLWFNVFYMLLSYPVGILADRIGKVPVLLAGYALFIVTVLGFAAAQSILLFYVLFLLYGVTQAFMDGVEKAFVSELVDPEKKGSNMGIFYMLTGFGNVGAGLIAGYFWDRNQSLPFIISACLAGAAFFILLAGFYRKRRTIV